MDDTRQQLVKATRRVSRLEAQLAKATADITSANERASSSSSSSAAASSSASTVPSEAGTDSKIFPHAPKVHVRLFCILVASGTPPVDEAAFRQVQQELEEAQSFAESRLQELDKIREERAQLKAQLATAKTQVCLSQFDRTHLNPVVCLYWRCLPRHCLWNRSPHLANTSSVRMNVELCKQHPSSFTNSLRQFNEKCTSSVQRCPSPFMPLM